VLQTTNKPSRSSKYSVAFQGEIGAYSQSAIYAFFGKDNVSEVLPFPTLRQVFQNLDRKGPRAVDYAVVPLENSLAGTIGETLDLLLLSNNLRIVGEVRIPISHALIAHENCPSITKIRKVISHPQAIAQCKEYLDAHDWEQVPVYDTAGAAKMIRDENLDDTAAIAGEFAAEIYALKIFARRIEDDHSNQTRFIVITSNSSTHVPEGNEKSEDTNYRTSIIFSTEHKPGSLVESLSTLSSRKINLTKIESRPMKSRPWEYYFYVDFEGHEKDENCRSALEELRKRTIELKILGSYNRA
jgi:prephenate dehydratase